MMLEKYEYTCNSCKNKFPVFTLPEEVYGEFILRTITGKEAYLLAIGDPIFKEVRTIVNSKPELQYMDEQVDIIHEVFGVVCDKASDGSEYKIELHPRCPACGSHKMYSWGSTNPRNPELIENNIPPVTYNHWNTLSDIEKKNLVYAAIDRELEKK